MGTEELDRPLEDLSLTELVDALERGTISFADIRENETARRRFNRLVIKHDMEHHRDIYDRLAEV